MNKIILVFVLLLVFFGCGTGALVASDNPTPATNGLPVSTPVPANAEKPSVPIPVFLRDSDRIPDSAAHPLPPPPGKYADGKPFSLKSSGGIPPVESVKNLADPAVLSQIEAINKSENKPRAYYWHSLNGVDYCHCFSASGHHWYGWVSGGDWLWALYQSSHFWWHDAYAERWLYFDRGYWRWQGPKKNQFQVYLEDGHYHVCDAKGVLGEDLFTLGTEEEMTQPIVKETVVPLSKQKEDNPGPGGSMEDSGRGALDSLNHH
jgi:hypothetical protein